MQHLKVLFAWSRFPGIFEAQYLNSENADRTFSFSAHEIPFLMESHYSATNVTMVTETAALGISLNQINSRGQCGFTNGFAFPEFD